jgi:molybdate transport system ATP-binding protein
MTAELVARFHKRYSDTVAVEADLRRPTDRFSITVLFGPSGCGKTTILRCLAGLIQPSAGQIRFGESVWFDSATGVCRTPQNRGIGYLFQEYALFPHLTVADNVGYGLSGLPREERRKRVMEMLNRFDLAGLQSRYPHQTSGGQQQRIALARVLIRKPQLLLLDEPLSALDNPTRELLRSELRRTLAGFHIPVILVTHDRTEAMALADHLLIMDRGRVCQQGSVADVFNHPIDMNVARMTGVETVVRGRVVAVADGLATITVGTATLVAVAPDPKTTEVTVCIRGEDVLLEQRKEGVRSARNRLEGVIRGITREGPLFRISLDCGFDLAALVTRPACEELGLREGGTIVALIKAPAIHLIPLVEGEQIQ